MKYKFKYKGYQNWNSANYKTIKGIKTIEAEDVFKAEDKLIKFFDTINLGYVKFKEIY